MNRIFIFIAAGILFSGRSSAQHDPLREFRGKIGKGIEDTEQWWPERIKAPAGAPNVLLVMLDDVGFGASSAFGGLIETPVFDELANGGLRYTNFHTTGICSPTRAALLTGRNAHSVGMGHHAELGIGTPGYSGDIPFEAGNIAEILRENGYNTFALGKWHGNRSIDLNAAGPFNRYPTGRGFDHFFGFLGGATDQWYPNLVEGVSQVKQRPDKKHLNEQLADKAIEYIANQKSADAEKPFFLYLAPGAAHSPHQVSREWIDRYRGTFDEGWDAYREKVFKRQLEAGLIPRSTVLPPRQEPLRAWSSLSSDEKKVYARFFETYAGFLSYTDYEIGRVVNYLKEIEQFDNTLILVIIGDNGGSKEGSYTGTTGSAGNAKGHETEFLLKNYDKIGSEYTYPNYPLAWSQATNTPFRYWKSDANSEGATHNPLIIHYPGAVKTPGGIRTQYGHVIDILPTIVELTGSTVPGYINGYKQLPLHGVSLAYSIGDSKAPSKRTQQYYEIHGGRAIYKDGWKAAVYHPRALFGDGEEPDYHFRERTFDTDKWELYNLNEDWNETKDLASQHPARLKELIALFDEDAKKYNVYPLRNYRAGVAPSEIKPVSTLYGGTTARTKVNVGNGKLTITANFELKSSSARGVIFANGGLNRGGSSLYLKDNKLYYTVTDGSDEHTIVSDGLFFAGRHSVRLEFDTDDNLVIVSGEGKAQTFKLPLPRKSFLASAGNDGISLGHDYGVPVTKQYAGPFDFTDIIGRLTIQQEVK